MVPTAATPGVTDKLIHCFFKPWHDLKRSFCNGNLPGWVTRDHQSLFIIEPFSSAKCFENAQGNKLLSGGITCLGSTKLELLLGNKIPQTDPYII